MQLLRSFLRIQNGNFAVWFGLAALPLVGAVGAGVDFASAAKSNVSMQSALDSAALYLAKNGSQMSSSDIQAAAQKWFNASFTEGDVANISVTASYDANALSATVSASGTYNTQFLKAGGFETIPVSGTATAKMEGKRWEVCVMVTSPASNHTLKTTDTAQINFYNCMVQVNTQNWDAVEARNTSYIHSTNGDNCFVGDIHFGDILPAKDPTCTFFPDPFANYAMPASASTCTYTGMRVTTNGQTLNPGTYCGGLQLQNISNVTFNPGVYIISGGDLQAQGQGNSNVTINAQGVTFLFTGHQAGLTLKNVVFNITPNENAGQFSDFLFYLDQSSCAGGNCNFANKSDFENVAINSSGIIYLVGQEMDIGSGSQITLNTGCILADFILPGDNSVLNVYGRTDASTSAQIALQKTGTGTNPVLVH
ncbi:MAG: pilus assembly protein [Alphaproteobacteria bacterium]|nr:pilus assembly protein [Alphaproteobacteria bacterium]